MEVSGDGSSHSDSAVGLHHVAFKIGDDIADLREAKVKLEAAGVRLRPIDHEVAKSLYFQDPDGNGVELYVDASDVWRREPQRVAQIAPLAL
jgi:catechol 2,3-dioxygenase